MLRRAQSVVRLCSREHDNGQIFALLVRSIRRKPSNRSARYLAQWFDRFVGALRFADLRCVCTGGPGCSSLEGLLYELGPFKFENPGAPLRDGDVPTLVKNPWAWNRNANLLFIEATSLYCDAPFMCSALCAVVARWCWIFLLQNPV